MAQPTHYDLLELPAGASAEELRLAFRRLSKRYHPDTTSLPAPEAAQAFTRLRAAYAVLSDPAARRAYDSQLTAPRPLPPPPVVVTRPVPLRRALSGGEWLALLLLGLAMAASLVLGLGLAWARGLELVRPPSWMMPVAPAPAAAPGPAAATPVAPAMVTALPPATTPLYNHPLPALEEWLRQLGAVQQGGHASGWDLHRPDWSAELLLDVEELRVSWQQEGRETSRTFPYGLSRADVEAAILAGP